MVNHEICIHNEKFITSTTLTMIAYSINGAGGGGNVKELYNPSKEGGIIGLVEELGRRRLPLYSSEQLSPETPVCCVARLGRPGAKADFFAREAAQAITIGLEKLGELTRLGFPEAIVPVEATAGQMARSTRAALAASEIRKKQIGILDGDICGGMAVPAVPLAFNIFEGMNKHPEIVLIQLKTDEKGNVIPDIESMEEKDPFELEKKLREMASSSEMGAVWFAWLMMPVSDFRQFFTVGSVSSAIRRGRIVLTALRQRRNPTEALIESKEGSLIIEGEVVEVIDESSKAPGFAQYSYKIVTPNNEEIIMVARNEYVILYRKDGTIIARAPQIIAALTNEGPIQSHVLKPNTQISIITATPQAILNSNEDQRRRWEEIWKEYFKNEAEKRTWNHPF
jgi:DUF917 family protein